MNAPGAPLLAAKDFKSDYKPVWCPGCGDYSVLAAITKSLAMLGLRPENVALVSGIGCSSRIPAYTTCYGFHGVHGRSLPAATGLKAARPDLTVLVASGDGETALVTFGSCTAPAREALARARAAGVAVRLVSVRLLAPAQPERLKRALQGVKRVLVLEQNHSGQFLRYLRAEYDLPGEVRSLRRPGPLPFRPAEIHAALEQWSRA